MANLVTVLGGKAHAKSTDNGLGTGIGTRGTMRVLCFQRLLPTTGTTQCQAKDQAMSGATVESPGYFW